jgi:hypothetical protein
MKDAHDSRTVLVACSADSFASFQVDHTLWRLLAPFVLPNYTYIVRCPGLIYSCLFQTALYHSPDSPPTSCPRDTSASLRNVGSSVNANHDIPLACFWLFCSKALCTYVMVPESLRLSHTETIRQTNDILIHEHSNLVWTLSYDDVRAGPANCEKLFEGCGFHMALHPSNYYTRTHDIHTYTQSRASHTYTVYHDANTYSSGLYTTHIRSGVHMGVKERVQVFTAGNVSYRYPYMVYPRVSIQMTDIKSTNMVLRSNGIYFIPVSSILR